MDKKNQVLLTTIAVATLLVAVVGATFAYFSARIVENNKTTTKLKSADLEIEFVGTQEITTDCVVADGATTGTATDNNNTTITPDGNGQRTYNCVSGNNWEPGSTGTKIFTVENTSDFDMTFDINFTRVVNNFERQYVAGASADFTYALTGEYVASTNNDYPISSTVQMVTGGTGVAESTKAPLSISGVKMPVDGSVSAGGEITYGENVIQVAKIFIPKKTKQQFSLVVTYANLPQSDGYEYGDPAYPNNQNVDQGKVFRATVAIDPNGIDPGTRGN